MKVIKINSHLFDVFYGNGWTNWSRWTRSNTGFLKQTQGEEVPVFVKSFVIKTLGGK